MKIDEIIRLVCLSVSLLVSLVGFVTAVIKDIKTKRWDELKDSLLGFIAKAETLTEYSGEEKKSAVLNWASEFCKLHGIKFDAEKVGDEIEQLIAFTKTVNSKEE